MEDRYLFRAKRVDDGKWVIGNLIYGSDGKIYIVCSADKESLDNENTDLLVTEWYEVFGKTICQCTGLKDKNGKLIWENDIVAFWDTYSTENGMAESDCLGEVIWEEETLSFEVTNRLSAESYEVLEDCSVIGNKFDNPELLESEE